MQVGIALFLIFVPVETGFHVKQYPQTPGFIGLAVHLMVWTPLLILTHGRIGISLVVQKIFKK